MRKMLPFLPAAVLGIGCALIWDPRVQNAAPLAAPISGVLIDVPGHSVTEQILSAEEQRVAGMSSYVARLYHKQDAIAFSTLVSYYERQTRGRTIHSPRNCLPGAGWEITTAGIREIAVGSEKQNVNRYIISNGRARAIAYYWYQGRGRVTANEYVVKWNLFRDAALKGRTEEALVRVIVPLSAKRTEADADRLADDIVARLMGEVERVLPNSGEPASLVQRDFEQETLPRMRNENGTGNS